MDLPLRIGAWPVFLFRKRCTTFVAFLLYDLWYRIIPAVFFNCVGLWRDLSSLFWLLVLLGSLLLSKPLALIIARAPLVTEISWLIDMQVDLSLSLVDWVVELEKNLLTGLVLSETQVLVSFGIVDNFVLFRYCKLWSAGCLSILTTYQAKVLFYSSDHLPLLSFKYQRE